MWFRGNLSIILYTLYSIYLGVRSLMYIVRIECFDLYEIKNGREDLKSLFNIIPPSRKSVNAFLFQTNTSVM